jgi:hypothetical protein
LGLIELLSARDSLAVSCPIKQPKERKNANALRGGIHFRFPVRISAFSDWKVKMLSWIANDPEFAGCVIMLFLMIVPVLIMPFDKE